VLGSDCVANALEQELEVYREKLPTLLLEEGKFALIGDNALVGVFDNYGDALKAGYEKFGLRPFLVKEIKAVEQAHFISRFSAAV
jgi:hypothetical protein